MTLRQLPWIGLAAATALNAPAQDWPQWRGPNRDARATGFVAPASWPKELTQKWKVTVGDGVASPSLVGDRLYVFSREEGSEVIRCLNATDGKELWNDRYDSLGATGPAQGFSGPRSSPAVAQGRVVTLGVRGMLSCLDAATGKVLWRKDDFRAYPNFHPSSSPLIVGPNAIAQLGGRENGALVAYDLASGEQKWKWNGPSPSYASPILLSAGGTQLIVAHTESKLVAIHAANGELAWESAGEPRGGGPGAGPGGGPGGGPAGPGGPGGEGGRRGGGGRDYRASTPVANGDILITAGRGVKAVRLARDGAKFTATELWNNPEKSVQFNSPVLKDGLLYGLSPNNELFCLNAKDGKTAWSAPLPGSNPAAGGRAALPALGLRATAFGLPAPADPLAPPPPPAQRPAGADGPEGRRGPGGPGGPGGRRGPGGGGSGYGNIVDAGSVLMALTPGAQLVVFAPSDKELKILATYKVSTGQTHAYPVPSGKRIFIKDKDSVTLWSVD